VLKNAFNHKAHEGFTKRTMKLPSWKSCQLKKYVEKSKAKTDNIFSFGHDFQEGNFIVRFVKPSWALWLNAFLTQGAQRFHKVHKRNNWCFESGRFQRTL